MDAIFCFLLHINVHWGLTISSNFFGWPSSSLLAELQLQLGHPSPHRCCWFPSCAAGLALASIASLVKTKPYKHYVYQLQQYPVLNGLVKFGVAFPLAFHYLGGLRHMFWDTAKGQDIAFMKKSSMAISGAAAVVGVAAVFTQCSE